MLAAGTKVNSGKAVADLGGDFVAYLAGEKIMHQEIEDLRARYKILRSKDPMPAPLVPSEGRVGWPQSSLSVTSVAAGDEVPVREPLHPY